MDVDRDAFQIRLDHAIQIQADFNALGTDPDVADVVRLAGG